MVSAGGTLSQVGDSLRGLLLLSRHNRLHDQIRVGIDLYERASRHPDLAGAAENLAAVVNVQSAVLRAAVTQRGPRAWDWGGLIVSWIVAGLIAWPAWVWLHPLDSWWTEVLCVAALIVAAIFVLVGISILLERRPADESIEALNRASGLGGESGTTT